jgi:hypothetical protein
MNLHSAIPVLTVMNFHHGLLASAIQKWVISDAFIDALVDTVFSGLEPNGGGT